MHTVRRLYLYLLSGVSLAVLLVGLNLLLSVLFGALGLGATRIDSSAQMDREQLSLAAALTVVGLLVWGVHWWFVERSLHPSQPGAAEEHGSTLRALYLTGVLGALLAFGSVAAVGLLQTVVRAVLGVESFETDLRGTLSTLLVTGSAWGYHAWVRRRDLAIPVGEAAAWLPRLYLYGASFVALILLALAIGELLGLAFDALVGSAPAFDGGSRIFSTASQLGAVAWWTVVWLGHWWYASRLTSDPGWRGAEERPSRLRLAYFVAVVTSSVLAVAWFAAEAVRAILVALLNAADAAGADPSVTLTMAVVAPLLSAVPWALAWWIHRGWMLAESLEEDGATRSATIDRLDAGGAALVGLGFTAVGAAWLIGIGVDAALGGSRTVGDFWRVELAQYLSLAIVGVAPWAWNWARLQRRSQRDPAGEAGSPVRRSILLIVLAVAVLTSLGSLAFVLYRLFGTLLGVGFSGSAVSALSTPVGSLLAAGAVAGYHAIVLRRDQQLRARAAALAPPSGPVVEPVAVASTARLALLLTGPGGADLDAAVESLRAALPAGFGLEPTDTVAT